VRFDYSLDTSGLFNNPAARVAMDRVATAITAGMTDSLTAITPSGTNTWTAQVYDSASGTTKSLPGLSVGADEIVVYLTGGALGQPLGIASGGAYSARGAQSWLDTIRTRGQGGVDAGTDFSPWGGLIAFNTATNWDFTAGAPAANQYDFDSVALHEMMHVFGFGLNNPSFTRYVSNGSFVGPNAVSVYGGSIPMQTGDSAPDHFGATVKYAGQQAVMNPAIQVGTVKKMTALEYASLRDVGWGVSYTSPAVPPAPPVPTTASAVTPTPTSGRFAVSTGDGGGGSVSVYDGSGQLVSQGAGISANGGTRVATGDVDGDGVADTVYGAAPGDLPQVTVVSGRTGSTIASFLAYEPAFRGGVNVAVGHITGGLRADIVVGADAGGGPRVRVFAGGDPNAVVADFWGIADENFRGGVRVAAGDINHDGRADLVVAAGPGGGPRVALFDGLSVAGGSPQRIVWDFYAYAPTVQDGAYVAVGDFNGDGFADVAFGPGSGSAHLKVTSGSTIVHSGVDAALNAPLVSTIFAQPDPYSGGARVAAGDFDGDGRTDVITATGKNTTGQLYLLRGNGVLSSNTMFGGTVQQYGLNVG